MTFNAIECTIQFCNIIFIRVHIGHTTTTIDIVDVHTITVDNQQDALIVCHRTSISATVEVTDRTVLQVPRRTDGHWRLVVAAKDTGKVEGIAGQITLEG